MSSFTTQKPKTLEDFPHFLVTAVGHGETTPDGYTGFEFEKHFRSSLRDCEPPGFGS